MYVLFLLIKKKKSKFLNPQVSIYPYIGKDIYDVPIFVPMFCSCKNYNNQALVPKNLRASNWFWTSQGQPHVLSFYSLSITYFIDMSFFTNTNFVPSTWINLLWMSCGGNLLLRWFLMLDLTIKIYNPLPIVFSLEDYVKSQSAFKS